MSVTPHFIEITVPRELTPELAKFFLQLQQSWASSSKFKRFSLQATNSKGLRNQSGVSDFASELTAHNSYPFRALHTL